VTHGIAAADQIDTVPWNGFPKRFTSPVSDPDYDAAEGPTCLSASIVRRMSTLSGMSSATPAGKS
jgi:hypothetical protein